MNKFELLNEIEKLREELHTAIIQCELNKGKILGLSSKLDCLINELYTIKKNRDYGKM